MPPGRHAKTSLYIGCCKNAREAAVAHDLAVVWWRLTLAACQRWGAALLRLAPLRALHFRNTLGCPDVHAAEAALFASSAAAHHVD